MEKDSALHLLMGVRMNGVMNDITNSDGNIRRTYGNLTNTPAGWRRWNCRRKSGCWFRKERRTGREGCRTALPPCLSFV